MCIFKHKKILLILLLIVLGIAIYSIFIYRFDKKYTANMEYNENGAQAKYYYVEDGIIYRFKPAYIYDLSCFGSVSTTDAEITYLDEQGNVITDGMLIVLYIWPHFFKETEFGLDFYEVDNDNNIQFQTMINEKCELIGDDVLVSDNVKISDVLQLYDSEIQFLIDKANSFWSY